MRLFEFHFPKMLSDKKAFFKSSYKCCSIQDNSRAIHHQKYPALKQNWRSPFRLHPSRGRKHLFARKAIFSHHNFCLRHSAVKLGFNLKELSTRLESPWMYAFPKAFKFNCLVLFFLVSFPIELRELVLWNDQVHPLQRPLATNVQLMIDKVLPHL